MEELTLRQQMYGFLAALLARVPDRELALALQAGPVQAELRRLLADVPAAGPLLDRVRDLDAAALAEELAVEYTMLFSVPGSSQVVPYESVYRDKLVVEIPPQPEINFAGDRRVLDGQYWGDSTVAVAGEYGAEDFDVEGEIPDSLGLELAFMSHLCGRERELRAGGNGLAGEAYAYRQERFLREHLLQWVPTFVQGVQQKCPHGFYALAALLVLRYLESEAAAFSPPAIQVGH